MDELRRQSILAEGGNPDEAIDLDEVPQADPSYQPIAAPPQPTTTFERPGLPNFGVYNMFQKYVPEDAQVAIRGKAADIGQYVQERQLANEEAMPLGREADMADKYPRAFLAGKKVVDATGATENIKRAHADAERREANEAAYKDAATKAMVNEEVARKAIVALKKRAEREKLEKDRDTAGQRYRIERPIYQSEKK